MWKFLTALLLALVPALAWGQENRLETKNFVIHHSQDDDYAKKVGVRAENERKRIMKFFEMEEGNWPRRCEMWCFVDKEAYQKKLQETIPDINTKAPGISFFVKQRGDVVFRTINLDITTPGVWDNIMPHEITHCTLVELCCGYAPRWIDEGTACCLETPEQRKFLRERAFSFEWKLEDHVFQKSMQSSLHFYSQSFVAVDYLINAKGMKVYKQFLQHHTMGNSIENSLNKYYGFKDVKALEDAVKAAGAAQGLIKKVFRI